MSKSRYLAAPRLLTEPELLLAVSNIAGIGTGFQNAVDQIERLLVESELCTGLVVLEKRGALTFPLAGSGGPIQRATPQTILSRPVKVGTRSIQVVFLSVAASSRRSRIAVNFVTEQIGQLLVRDLARQCGPRNGSFERHQEDCSFGWYRSHA